MRSLNQAPAVSAEIDYLADHRDVIPVVAKWIFEEWSFLYTGKTVHIVEKLLQTRLHKKVLPLTLVAFKTGKPVGTVSLKEFEIESRRDLTPWVTSLYVVKRRRGQGIGAGLMKAVEEKAARLGIKKLYLFTADSGLASRFYSKLGWKAKEKTQFSSFPIIVMVKKVG
jgi:predicted N-acetyltransferase YhbS